MMDLAGIMEAHPNFEVLRQLLKRKNNVWLEIGMRNEDDLFDAFAMGVSYAVAGSLCCRSMDMFKVIFELSDKCIPCLYLDQQRGLGETGGGTHRSGGGHRGAEGDRVRRDRDHRPSPARHPVRLLRWRWSPRALGHGVAIHVGGGITEKDFESLEKMGVAGALVDPFTPIIEDIVELPEGSPAATVTSAPTRLDAPTGTSSSNTT